MKKYFFFISLLFAVQSTVADTPKNGEGKELKTRIEKKETGNSPILHAPANRAYTDLLLVVDASGITILFNGDFGTGTYQIYDANTGSVFSNTVIAFIGGSEYIPFSNSESISFDFNIEFEDGSWCQLSWND